MARSKFNVSGDKSKRTYNGIVFDSAMEMKFYRDWCIPKMECGEIVGCERQVKYILQPKFTRAGKTIQPITYVADFVITYADGSTEVIDIKGCPDNVALLKRKMFWYVFPDIDYRWLTYSGIDGGWVEYEVVKEARKKRKELKGLT